jgi:hypothetical protein
MDNALSVAERLSGVCGRKIYRTAKRIEAAAAASVNPNS